MGFKIIPAVDLKGGRCVQLVQGKKDTEIVSLDNPVEVAGKWIDEGARTLHIIDLDGAFQETNRNTEIIRRIIDEYDIITHVGGGIRSHEDAVKLLDFGADRIILGTLAVENHSEVSKLSDEFSSQRIMVALDSREGEVAVDGWSRQSGKRASDLGVEFQELGAGSILFTNIDVEGRLQGIEINPIKEVVQSVSIPVIASGGITTMDDLHRIRDAGASGAVIGSAIYKGSIILSEAIRVMSV